MEASGLICEAVAIFGLLCAVLATPVAALGVVARMWGIDDAFRVWASTSAGAMLLCACALLVEVALDWKDELAKKKRKTLDKSYPCV
jgi:hypothetical protein